MEQQRDYYVANEGQPLKSGKGNYERQARGIYKKHKLEKKANVRHFINKNIDTNKGWENDENPFRHKGSSSLICTNYF